MSLQIWQNTLWGRPVKLSPDGEREYPKLIGKRFIYVGLARVMNGIKVLQEGKTTSIVYNWGFWQPT